MTAPGIFMAYNGFSVEILIVIAAISRYWAQQFFMKEFCQFLTCFSPKKVYHFYFLLQLSILRMTPKTALQFFIEQLIIPLVAFGTVTCCLQSQCKQERVSKNIYKPKRSKKSKGTNWGVLSYLEIVVQIFVFHGMPQLWKYTRWPHLFLRM